jgi:hypothetical protein
MPGSKVRVTAAPSVIAGMPRGRHVGSPLVRFDASGRQGGLGLDLASGRP